MLYDDHKKYCMIAIIALTERNKETFNDVNVSMQNHVFIYFELLFTEAIKYFCICSCLL